MTIAPVATRPVTATMNHRQRKSVPRADQTVSSPRPFRLPSASWMGSRTLSSCSCMVLLRVGSCVEPLQVLFEQSGK
jgi:hypothetical protein